MTIVYIVKETIKQYFDDDGQEMMEDVEHIIGCYLNKQKAEAIIKKMGETYEIEEQELDESKLDYCSFCGKDQIEVELKRGPGVNICKECITLSSEEFAS